MVKFQVKDVSLAILGCDFRCFCYGLYHGKPSTFCTTIWENMFDCLPSMEQANPLQLIMMNGQLIAGLINSTCLSGFVKLVIDACIYIYIYM